MIYFFGKPGSADSVPQHLRVHRLLFELLFWKPDLADPTLTSIPRGLLRRVQRRRRPVKKHPGLPPVPKAVVVPDVPLEHLRGLALGVPVSFRADWQRRQSQSQEEERRSADRYRS